MLQQLLHVHLVHYIKAVFPLSHVKNGLTHELVEHQNVVLLLEVSHQRFDQVVIQKRTLGDERVDLLLLDLPADSENQQCILDGVELIDNGVLLWIFAIENLLIDINQQVHLID